MEDEPRACNPAYSSMSNDELINYSERRVEHAPIDMDAVQIALYAAAATLRHFIATGADVVVARERLIGHLFCFDSVLEDMRQQPALPPEALGKAMIAASQEARKQRESELARAGLSRRGSAA